jgi:hypothetical protein
MKAKTRIATKKSSKKRKIAIAATITIMAAIIIASAIRQPTKNETNPPKKDPNEYFQFLDISAFGTRVSQSVVRIQTLYFKVKPIGGDAHNFVISGTMIDPAEYWREVIENGTEEAFEVTFQSSLQVYKKDDGYPITIKIRSDEAEGYVTLILKDEDIISY